MDDSRLLSRRELVILLHKAREGTLDLAAEELCHCPGCVVAKLPSAAIRLRHRYRELYPYLFDPI